MFSALHDQLASLNRHAQLTRCFSAVAELLVMAVITSSVVAEFGLLLYCARIYCAKIFVQTALILNVDVIW